MKNNLPKLEYTVLPRVSGMKAIIDELNPIQGKRHLDYVVDITAASEIDYSPHRLLIGFRGKNRTRFLFRVYRVDEVNFV